MNVSLKPELEKFVEEQVKAGRFSSATEVLEAGLACRSTGPQIKKLRMYSIPRQQLCR